MNDQALTHIAAWFEKRDERLRQKNASVVHNTSHGIFGSTSVEDVFTLCKKLALHKEMRFCDLGSGDGRVALVAALFCDSTGIEGDHELHEIAMHAKAELLPQIPELSRCTLINADYTTLTVETFDVFFTFADHAWTKNFEHALLAREKPGIVVAHQDIFKPQFLRKGPTIWVGQVPFVTYHIGK